MSLQDSLFSEDVENDITLFSNGDERKRVLVFPPVNNYRRFLIHQLVQDRHGDLFHTFSIGQGLARRTVVCYRTDLIRDPKLNGVTSSANGTPKPSGSACTMGIQGQRSFSVSPEHSRQRQVKSVPTVGIYRPPAARRLKNETTADSQQDQSPTDLTSSAKTNRQKRPDRAVYVPRHRRSADAGSSPQLQETCSSTRSRRNRSSTSSPTFTSSKSPPNSTSEDAKLRHPAQDALDLNAERLTTNTDHNFESKTEEEEQATSPIDSPCRSVDSSRSTTKNVDQDTLNADCVDVSQQEDEIEKHTNISKAERSTFIENKLKEEITGLEAVQRESSVVTKDLDNCVSSSDLEADTAICWKQSMTETSTECEDTAEKYFCGSVGSNYKVEDCSTVESSSDTANISMSSREEKDQQVKEESLNCEEMANRKGERVVKQNERSEILVISGKEKKEESTKKEVPTAPVSPPEKKVKKVERPKSKPAPPPSPPVKINRDECDWDTLFDDNGDCLDPTLIEELTSAVGEVMIEQPKNDYKAYTRPVEVSNDEFAHVIEIYNFPSDFKTSDLAAAFSPFKNGGFELKWVDDTHCLGVFSSPLIAAEVLASDHPFVKTRPLSEATALSKTKARRSAEFLQPYRSRPETCAALARRLVTGALGVRLSTARQEREREKIVLREAKEKRRLANKQRDDAWEGVIAEK